jgi:hypothetical protein
MFRYARGAASKRKSRLFACACCRRIWQLFPDERSRRAAEVSERYADGLATKQEMSAARSDAANAAREAMKIVRSRSRR